MHQQMTTVLQQPLVIRFIKTKFTDYFEEYF